jgi:tetratricopeptide (TPR) repeat protein
MSLRRAIALLTPLVVFVAVFAALSVGRADERVAREQLPDDANALASLGDTYLQRSRETGVDRYVTLASDAYRESLALDPSNPIALTGAATTALIAHDFSGGLEIARQAHRAAPDLAITYLPLIDGLIETGDYATAAREIDNLLNLKPSVAAYTRLSYFEELHGNRDAALRAMRLAADTAPPSSEGRAFATTLVADLLFDAGRYREAGRWYERAVDGFEEYGAAEVGLLNVAAAEGRFAEARTGFERLVDDEGQIELSDELGRLEELAGNEEAAAERYGVISRLHARELEGGASPDFGQVLFEADHGSPKLGVDLGRELWKASKSVTTADSYAWALFAAGKTKAAERMSAHAMKLGGDDPSFLYHAGVIAGAAGEEDRARRLLEIVLRRTPGFDPLFAAEAREALRDLLPQ